MEQDLELVNFNINLELSSIYLKRLRISSHDDELGDAAIERLGRLIRPLAQLLVVNRLLDQVQNGLGQMGIGKGVGFGVHFFSHFLLIPLRSRQSGSRLHRGVLRLSKNEVLFSK